MWDHSPSQRPKAADVKTALESPEVRQGISEKQREWELWGVPKVNPVSFDRRTASGPQSDTDRESDKSVAAPLPAFHADRKGAKSSVRSSSSSSSTSTLTDRSSGIFDFHASSPLVAPLLGGRLKGSMSKLNESERDRTESAESSEVSDVGYAMRQSRTSN